ncbi:YcaO-like family protein [Sphingomonas solaris]|uniref:SagD family bacteriocin biosynthesis docking scaffold n=1 Tax=Alterirhizorhabdus solaris TaxID=2529389 RepID=A0A558R7P7_9SPHN|nr:YcaO-like family protein [Sphingomonas solaris]TVV75377.1 SagD family bacteriocin biosynthesis docking scaffold [Sphingomonas solaris]
MRLIAPLAKAIGVTRLADVTGLDRIGLPVFQAIRPRALSLSVSQGKGLSRDAARVSALVEAIELHHAERVTVDGYGAAFPDEGVLWARMSPASGQAAPFDPARPRGWITATDLLGGGAVRVPHGLVSMDCTVPREADLWPNTNGLAAGNDIVEAEVAALCEVIERDSQERWLAGSTAARRATALDPTAIDMRAGCWMFARIARAGLRCTLWDMSDAHGVATIGCAIIEPGPAATLALPPAFGAGCHPRRAVALVRAVAEAAQTRVALIAGSRDDLTDGDYADPGGQRRRLALATHDFGGPPARRWQDVPDHPLPTDEAERACLLAACARAGGGVVARIDLTPPACPIAIVRLVVPGFGDHDRPPA